MLAWHNITPSLVLRFFEEPLNILGNLIFESVEVIILLFLLTIVFRSDFVTSTFIVIPLVMVKCKGLSLNVSAINSVSALNRRLSL